MSQTTSQPLFMARAPQVEARVLPSLQGHDVHEVLSWLHTHLRPKRYLEIGTWTGGSLSLASCASIAVDPNFELVGNVVGSKPLCALYQVRSDDFFQSYDPTQILGGRIDLAFLDGLHLFEVLLRDFINTEKFCNRNSVIALHDCLPPHLAWASRIWLEGSAWTGDVWKVLLILRKHRPDLHIYALDSTPSGLVLITNLNPGSSILSDRYYDVTAEYRDLDLLTLEPDAFAEAFQTIGTDRFDTAEKLSRFFWL